MTDINGGTARRGSLRALSYLYYIANGLVLLFLVTKWQKSFLPAGIATQIGHNSESFCLALAVGVIIQFARPRWTRNGGQVDWMLVGVVAAVWLLLAVGVYYLGLPPTIKTLNEPLAAAGMLAIYLALPRPLKYGWTLPAAVAIVAFILVNTTFVNAQAETVTSFVFVALAVDVFQRTILDPKARDNVAVVGLWWAFLAIAPALFLASPRHGVGGFLGDVVDYLARGAEGFWGALIIGVYFAARRYVVNDAVAVEPRARHRSTNGV